MKYIYLWIILLLQSMTFTVNAKTDIKVTLDKLIEQSHQRGLFNGNASVYFRGKPILKKSIGHADAAKQNSLSVNSTFALGSISKEFSAVAIMMLHEKGLIDIDAPVSRYVSGLQAWSEEVKVKHLINYTSGLPRLNFRAVKVASDIDNQLKQISTLKFTPGEGYLYSNHNVLLQIRLIEKLTKQSYSAFLENNFFQPLGMKNTSFNFNETNAVTAFNNDGVNDPNISFPIAIMPYSTIEDMQKWLFALRTGKLVSTSSLKVLFNSFDKNSQAALGHGKLKNDKVIKHRHHGSHFNFESLVYYNAELDLQVILLTNNKNFRLDNIISAVESIVQGKSYDVPKKSLYLAIRQTAYDDVGQGVKFYFELKETKRDLYDFDNNSALIRVGYKLLAQNKYQSAIKIFKLAATEFPDHANAFDSLAEAYYISGNLKAALLNYQASVKLDPQNKNGRKMIVKINELL